MKFVIDNNDPKKKEEEICKISLMDGFEKGTVRIMIENSQKKFTLATLTKGRIRLATSFVEFDGMECNKKGDPIVEDCDEGIIND